MKSMFELNSRQAERAFIRRLTKTGSVLTAKGKVNMYIKHDQTVIYLRSTRSIKGYKILRTKLRAAITFTCYKRTIVRKDLEIYCSFSSALLGILIEVFYNRARVIRTSTGLLRLSLLGTRYFFAGADTSPRDLEVAAVNGAKFVLFSYFYLRDRKAWKRHVKRLGLKILLDSGEFTRWKAEKRGKRVKPIRIDEYATFIKRHKDVLFGWFNLDRVGDAAASKKNAEYLKSMGLPPIEIWHVQSSMEVLDNLVAEDRPVIAIGGHVDMSEKARQMIFKKVFERHPEQNFHFLGGSSQLIKKYPWFSADSKGWIICRFTPIVINRNGKRISPEGMGPIERMSATVRELISLEAIFPETEDEKVAV